MSDGKKTNQNSKSNNLSLLVQVILDHEDFTDFTPFPDEGNSKPSFEYIKVTFLCRHLAFTHGDLVSSLS